MKKNIIIVCAVFFMLSCKEKASDKILDNNTATESEEKSISNAETSITPELVFNDGVGGAKIEFNMKEWDFGTITQGESVDTVFSFKNIGDQPLIISNAKGSCGCTVPKWPKDPIAPGESGTIDVKFNSANKSGKQNKRVTLTMNTTPNTTQLRVVGEIITPDSK